MERGWQCRLGLGRQATLSLSSEKRINALLTQLVAEGGRASLPIATTATIEINGVSSPLDLTKKASRLLAENAALVEAAIMSVDRIENL